jgi:hypothetical protein
MMKKHPPKLSAATAPGVLPINIGLAAQKMRAEASEEAAKSSRPKRGEGKEEGESKEELELMEVVRNKSKKTPNTCQWKPNSKNEKLRMYMCSNPFFVDPVSKQNLKTCAFHVSQCVRQHAPNTGAVAVPNSHGLCSMHYLAEFGAPPTPLPFPFPGSIDYYILVPFLNVY